MVEAHVPAVVAAALIVAAYLTIPRRTMLAMVFCPTRLPTRRLTPLATLRHPCLQGLSECWLSACRASALHRHEVHRVCVLATMWRSMGWKNDLGSMVSLVPSSSWELIAVLPSGWSPPSPFASKRVTLWFRAMGQTHRWWQQWELFHVLIVHEVLSSCTGAWLPCICLWLGYCPLPGRCSALLCDASLHCCLVHLHLSALASRHCALLVVDGLVAK